MENKMNELLNAEITAENVLEVDKTLKNTLKELYAEMKNLSVYIKKNKDSLLKSILFLILGVILFTNPGGILKFLSYIVGGILLIIGILNILSYLKTQKKLNIEDNKKLTSGIILIVLALVVVLFSSFVETTIRLVFGGWIIYSGVSKLIEAINIKNDKVTFYVTLVISILMILCGFYIAVTANLVFSLLGLFIMIYAILDIVSYVMNKK